MATTALRTDFEHGTLGALEQAYLEKEAEQQQAQSAYDAAALNVQNKVDEIATSDAEVLRLTDLGTELQTIDGHIAPMVTECGELTTNLAGNAFVDAITAAGTALTNHGLLIAAGGALEATWTSYKEYDAQKLLDDAELAKLNGEQQAAQKIVDDLTAAQKLKAQLRADLAAAERAKLDAEAEIVRTYTPIPPDTILDLGGNPQHNPVYTVYTKVKKDLDDATLQITALKDQQATNDGVITKLHPQSQIAILHLKGRPAPHVLPPPTHALGKLLIDLEAEKSASKGFSREFWEAGLKIKKYKQLALDTSTRKDAQEATDNDAAEKGVVDWTRWRDTNANNIKAAKITLDVIETNIASERNLPIPDTKLLNLLAKLTHEEARQDVNADVIVAVGLEIAEWTEKKTATDGRATGAEETENDEAISQLAELSKTLKDAYAEVDAQRIILSGVQADIASKTLVEPPDPRLLDLQTTVSLLEADLRSKKAKLDSDTRNHGLWVQIELKTQGLLDQPSMDKHAEALREIKAWDTIMTKSKTEFDNQKIAVDTEKHKITTWPPAKPLPEVKSYADEMADLTRVMAGRLAAYNTDKARIDTYDAETLRLTGEVTTAQQNRVNRIAALEQSIADEFTNSTIHGILAYKVTAVTYPDLAIYIHDVAALRATENARNATLQGDLIPLQDAIDPTSIIPTTLNASILAATAANNAYQADLAIRNTKDKTTADVLERQSNITATELNALNTLILSAKARASDPNAYYEIATLGDFMRLLQDPPDLFTPMGSLYLRLLRYRSMPYAKITGGKDHEKLMYEKLRNYLAPKDINGMITYARGLGVESDWLDYIKNISYSSLVPNAMPPLGTTINTFYQLMMYGLEKKQKAAR